MTELAPRIRRGVVGAFDEAAGLGTITSSGSEGEGKGEGQVEGQVEVPFHCIAIADGSRTIAIGTAVTFSLLAKLGRYEATDVRPA